MTKKREPREKRSLRSYAGQKVKLSEDPISEMRAKFVLACHHIAAILLLVMFVMIWSISYRTTMSKINIAIKYVASSVDGSGKTHLPLQNTEDGDFRASTVGCAVFSVNRDGVIDYYKLYENFPFLHDYDDVEEVAEKTIETVDKGKDSFKLNGRRYRVYGREDIGIKYYAFYDYSTEYVMLRNSAIGYGVAYVCSIIAVVLIAYLLSDGIIEPVKQSMENERTLTANASHELKTPLTIISANLSVIQSEPDSTVAENAKWLDSIEDQVKRMNGLIMDMLELSKLEQAETPTLSEVDLSEIVAGGILSCEALCFEKNIEIEDFVSDGLTVNGDRSMLERLTLILLDNAVKYTPSSGRITVELKEIAKKKIKLSVVNSGQGMSADAVAHAFDRFYKGDTARTQSANSSSFGLGLSIAKAICDKHGAEITCVGVEGEYTEFDVFFDMVKNKTEERK